VLPDGQVKMVKWIVAKRVAQVNDKAPVEKASDVEDVFRYLNQTASLFLLQKNEHIITTVPAVGLREPRSIRATRGAYGGPSFRVAKGVSMHVGAFRSTSSSREELKDIDGGDLVITNQRLFSRESNERRTRRSKKSSRSSPTRIRLFCTKMERIVRSTSSGLAI
jgi:hypothetical protein